MDEQRIVPVKLLEDCIREAGYVENYGLIRRLRAIISGPGVEPVAPAQAVPEGMALVPETIARLFTKEQLEFLASGYDLKYLPIYADQPDPTYILCWLFEVRDEHGKAICSREVMYTAIDDAMLAAAPQPPAAAQSVACPTDKEK